MKKVLCLLFALLLQSPVFSSDLILKTLEEEIQRNLMHLKKSENPPYFLSYTVTEIEETSLSAGYGALENISEKRHRRLDTEIRVGSPGLDNTHPLRGRASSFRDRRLESASFPVENDPVAFRNILWTETDTAFRKAVENLIKIKSQKKVKVEEEDPSPDFSSAPREIFSMEVPLLSLDRPEWGKNLKAWSSLFKSYPEIYSSGLRLSLVRSARYLVTSEGTRLKMERNHVRLSITAETRAEDGMEISLHENFDGSTFKAIPDEKSVRDAIGSMAKNLIALRLAPLAEPFSGPAILSGKASAVFFHEVLGHRLEGHRQKSEREGQTFTRKVGEAILPDFISVSDDPTLFSMEETELNGHYLYDDEGVRSERTTLVKSGILKNFLMSRSPVKGFGKSNGHGRRQWGYRAVSRMGNLIVESQRKLSDEDLRKRLKEEILKAKKPYGLFFKEIAGGFTITGRILPNAFNVRPVLVYKVFADGRPDTLVRGVDLIGTPLTPLSKILATADQNEIFNGYCGAESGYVPVSAVSPSLLIEEMEVQKKEKSEEAPPILKPPLHDSKRR